MQQVGAKGFAQAQPVFELPRAVTTPKLPPLVLPERVAHLMLAMALELAAEKPAYEDIASKFFEHFVYIARATHDRGGEGISLWNEADGFFYDVLSYPNGEWHKFRVRSLVGLIPLYAVEVLNEIGTPSGVATVRSTAPPRRSS